MACLFLNRGTCVLELLGGDGAGDMRRNTGAGTGTGAVGDGGFSGVEENGEGTPLPIPDRNRTARAVRRAPAERHYSRNRGADTGTPLLVLVDGDTASAAEVLVAALSCHRRAAVAGSRTVGKDVAQAVVALQHGAGLALTVRAYCDPHGRDLSGGIRPDLDVSWAGLGSGSRGDISAAHMRVVRASGGGKTPTPTVGTSEEAGSVSAPAPVPVPVPVPAPVPMPGAGLARALIPRAVGKAAVTSAKAPKARDHEAEAEAEAARCAGGAAVWSVEDVFVWAGMQFGLEI